MPTAVTLWLITPEAAARFDPALQTAAEQARWQGLRSARRRREWAVSRAFLQSGLVAAGAATSLSHSAGYAAVAVGPAGSRLGIDIESVRPRDFLALARLCCSAREQAVLRDLPAADQAQHFYALWTLKEAAIKALGLDFPADLAACEFTPGPPWSARLPAAGALTTGVFRPRPALALGAVVMAGAAAWECREWPARAAAGWSTPTWPLRAT